MNVMFPQSDVIKILNHLKRKYKDGFYYKMGYDEVTIDLIYPVGITGRNVVTKTFDFSEVLSWHKNPEREFERSWQKK